MSDRRDNKRRPSLLTLAVDNERQAAANASRVAAPKPAAKSPEKSPLLDALAREEKVRAARLRKLNAAREQDEAERAQALARETVKQRVEDDAPAFEPEDQDNDLQADEPVVYAPIYHNNTSNDDALFRPLIDPVIVASTIWKWKWPILGTTLTGTALGVILALSTPKTYTSYAQILLDPREVKLVERNLTPDFLANEAALALVDSQLQMARSSKVLERVIERTNLERDAEFNGTQTSGGFAAGVALIKSLFSNETPVDTRDRKTLENLRENLETDRTNRTFVINIGVKSESPRKAAMLANEVAKSFIEQRSALETDTAGAASDVLNERLRTMRVEVENAEQALEAYKAENGLYGETGDLTSSETVRALNAELAAAKTKTATFSAQAEAAKTLDINSAENGAVPAELVTPALTTFRAQLAPLRQNEASLRNSLGPRHPRLANASAATEAAREDVRRELQRIVAGTQSRLRQSIEEEQAIAAELSRAKAALNIDGEATVGLRELQTQAVAAKQIYEAALIRAREAGEIEATGSAVQATVIAEAEPPIDPSSVSRKLVMAGGTIGGAAFGIGLAFLAGIWNSVKANGNPTGPARAPFSPMPSGPAPSGSGTRRKDKSAPKRDNPASAPSFRPANTGAATATASSNQASDPMYSGTPYYGYPYAQQPMAPMPYNPAPYNHGPYAPVPMMQPFAAPYHAYAPMPYSPPQPMMHPHQMPQHAMGYPQPYPVAQTFQPAPPVPQNFAEPTPVHNDDSEMDELRQSVQDIKDVIEHLIEQRKPGLRRAF